MPKSLNIQDIMEMLPHRFPFLLIDRVVELSDELDRVVAIKNVTMNEPQFTGHFQIGRASCRERVYVLV